jgi:hypothetical protein
MVSSFNLELGQPDKYNFNDVIKNKLYSLFTLMKRETLSSSKGPENNEQVEQSANVSIDKLADFLQFFKANVFATSGKAVPAVSVQYSVQSF